jgi:hypothetical protein
VYYRNGCLAKSREIRERPVPEWKCCVVYNPITRKLIKLNLNAWLERDCFRLTRSTQVLRSDLIC